VSAAARDIAELARLGSSTVYEARGRRGLVEQRFQRLLPGSRVAGPARTVLCAQNDNRGVHELVSRLQPGEIAVLTMPEPEPVALIGDLLVTQLKERGAAGVLVDGAVRDLDELVGMGVPIWARWVHARGAAKDRRGTVDAPVRVGGATIRTGDVVVLDGDCVVVVEAEEVAAAVTLAQARERKEEASRRTYLAGAISYDLYGFRAQDQGEE
jgi:4-hydroxy-4-methyl-2-oxoglutarate aldolase